MNALKFLDPLIECFEKLPGVGQKTATRYAFQIVENIWDSVKGKMCCIIISIIQKLCRLLRTSHYGC